MGGKLLENRIHLFQEKFQNICRACRRSDSEVTVIAVSKKKPADLIREAYDLGIHNFGENYLQEALLKIQELKDLNICWHYIGQLQRKKIKSIVSVFEYIHSVDRIELAQEIDQRAQEAGVKQKVFLQINIAHEDTKAGVSIQESENLMKQMLELKNLEVVGLMAMPPLIENSEATSLYFRKMCQLRNRFRDEFLDAKHLNHLSMGTSDDYHLAIEEGATMIRVGTAILGERVYDHQ